MKTFIVAVVVAALLAAIATQIHSTLFTENTLALLVLFFVVAAASALVTVRFAVRQPEAKPAEAPQPSPQQRKTPVRHRRPAPPKDAKRETGTVKWFDRNKGFGFIVRGNSDEIFVHHRSIRQERQRARRTRRRAAGELRRRRTPARLAGRGRRARVNVKRLLTERLEAALAEAGADNAQAIVGPATRPEFGDYQANGAMAAAKRLKRKPRDLAQELIERRRPRRHRRHLRGHRARASSA